jgi:hypothetical protein
MNAKDPQNYQKGAAMASQIAKRHCCGLQQICPENQENTPKSFFT